MVPGLLKHPERGYLRAFDEKEETGIPLGLKCHSFETVQKKVKNTDSHDLVKTMAYISCWQGTLDKLDFQWNNAAI